MKKKVSAKNLSMENIVYILVAVISIQAIWSLYIIYRLALLVKAKDLYEAKSFSEKSEPESEDLGAWIASPITHNLFADVTPR